MAVCRDAQRVVAVGQRSRERSPQMQVANNVTNELPSREARPGRRVNNSAAGAAAVTASKRAVAILESWRLPWRPAARDGGVSARELGGQRRGGDGPQGERWPPSSGVILAAMSRECWSTTVFSWRPPWPAWRCWLRRWSRSWPPWCCSWTASGPRRPRCS